MQKNCDVQIHSASSTVCLERQTLTQVQVTYPDTYSNDVPHADGIVYNINPLISWWGLPCLTIWLRHENPSSLKRIFEMASLSEVFRVIRVVTLSQHVSNLCSKSTWWFFCVSIGYPFLWDRACYGSDYDGFLGRVIPWFHTSSCDIYPDSPQRPCWVSFFFWTCLANDFPNYAEYSFPLTVGELSFRWLLSNSAVLVHIFILFSNAFGLLTSIACQVCFRYFGLPLPAWWRPFGSNIARATLVRTGAIFL